MTAPSLPGAAPDPARLPPVPVIGVVSSPNSAWRGGMKHTVVMDGTSLASSCDRESAQFAVEIARLAIARALGGDGEPVAWAVERINDGVLCDISRHRAPLDRDWAGPEGHRFRVVPLYTRPAANGDTGEGERTLPTRGDVGRPEATRDPVFILQYRDKGRRPDSDRWRPVGVWFTREEAETFAAAHAHRWPDDRHGKRWQVYCVPADGEMARLLKAVTLRAVATPAATGGPDAR